MSAKEILGRAAVLLLFLLICYGAVALGWYCHGQCLPDANADKTCRERCVRRDYCPAMQEPADR